MLLCCLPYSYHTHEQIFGELRPMFNILIGQYRSATFSLDSFQSNILLRFYINFLWEALAATFLVSFGSNLCLGSFSQQYFGKTQQQLFLNSHCFSDQI